MGRTRGIALVLATSCVGYEAWTIHVQMRTRALGAEVNDTWSQITRDVTRQDTVVGKQVLAWALRATTEWFIHHLEEGTSSVSNVRRQEGRHSQ